MLHITNHDLNSWEGTEFERLGAGVETFLSCQYHAGHALLYSGQRSRQ